jgi:hypothetical protein
MMVEDDRDEFLEWGGEGREVHVLLMVYASDGAMLDAEWVAKRSAGRGRLLHLIVAAGRKPSYRGMKHILSTRKGIGGATR